MDPSARVELLAVGDINVRLGDSLTTLTPRVFPALASTASGPSKADTTPNPSATRRSESAWLMVASSSTTRMVVRSGPPPSFPWVMTRA